MNEIIEHGSQPPTQYDQLIQVALEKNADIDKLEKLLELKQKFEAGEARKAYYQALNVFQSKLGPIIKKREAHKTKYADIDDIAQAIRPVLEAVGLSYHFIQKDVEGGIQVTCVANHIAGHSEELSMSAPADSSGGKNSIQALASTVTYLRRYTLTGIFGITTGSDDNDGGKPDVTTEDMLNYMSVVRDEILSITFIKESLIVNDYSAAKEAWNELSDSIKSTLWRAPSKGGIFTTEERTKMKSNEWSAA